MRRRERRIRAQALRDAADQALTLPVPPEHLKRDVARWLRHLADHAERR